MSLNTQNVINVSEQSNAHKNTGNNIIYTEFMEEKNRGNLEPLIDKILNLTQFLNQPINDNSLRTNLVASSRVYGTHTSSSLKTRHSKFVSLFLSTSLYSV